MAVRQWSPGRWSRAGVLGAASVLLAAAAHAAAGGGGAPTPVLLLAALAVVPVLHRVLGDEAGTRLLLAVVGGLQVALHLLLAVSADPHLALIGLHQPPPMPMPMPMPMSAPMAGHGMSGGLMLAGHAVAVLLVVGVLRLAEASLWAATRARRAARHALAALLGPAAPLPRPDVRPLVVPQRRAAAPRMLVLQDALSRRGPPAQPA